MRSFSLITGLSALISFFVTTLALGSVDETCQKGLYVSLSPLSNDVWAQRFCSSVYERTSTAIVTTIVTETTVSDAVATTTSTTLTTTTASTTTTSTITTTTTSVSTSTTVTTTTSTSVSTETSTASVTVTAAALKKRYVGCQETKATSRRRPTAPVFHGKPFHQPEFKAKPNPEYSDGSGDSPSDYQGPAEAMQDTPTRPFHDTSPDYPWHGSPHGEDSPSSDIAYGHSTPTEYTPTIPTQDGYTSDYLASLYHGLLSLPPASASQYCSCYQSTETFTTSTTTITADTTVITSGTVTKVVTRTISTTSTFVSTTTTTSTVPSITEITSTDTASTTTTTTTTSTSTITFTPVPVATSCVDLAPSYTAANGEAFNIQCSALFFGGSNQIVTVPTENFRACLELCSNTANCVGIDYDRFNVLCVLLSSVGAGNNDPNFDRAAVV
ncbi:hypothetical protein PFICI_04500 [Pestalotiopsis fici W106-1]|uniref:Apple domain-containing protein n=1 Tax=Pestalotiopsis fici (strain W106-1 / CGMCC3.15140) TaxID=1229662 RepID=W3X9A7_PESFW|nr:uncharacterized protein PFICI_04500 [Pestalotiopsis fici W106-1]ETS82624.1 hypothetical protein PFICI_04500 [Pestalotiopsis fici W106-1]